MDTKQIDHLTRLVSELGRALAGIEDTLERIERRLTSWPTASHPQPLHTEVSDHD